MIKRIQDVEISVQQIQQANMGTNQVQKIESQKIDARRKFRCSFHKTNSHSNQNCFNQKENKELFAKNLLVKNQNRKLG